MDKLNSDFSLSLRVLESVDDLNTYYSIDTADVKQYAAEIDANNDAPVEIVLVEAVDAEEFIAKKGLQAKGKKVSAMDVKSVKFIEPLHKPEDDVIPSEEEVVDQAGENQAGEIDNTDVEEVIDLELPDDGQLSLF